VFENLVLGKGVTHALDGFAGGLLVPVRAVGA
jgi:hypothetical protein